MRRTMLVLALVALLVASALPAIAQDRNDRFDRDGFFGNGTADGVNQEIGQEADSGNVNVQGSVTSSGDYAQQCVAPLQFANTGNLQNAQGALQYGSTADDIGLGGSSSVFDPSVSTTCDQAVQQSAAASSR